MSQFQFIITCIVLGLGFGSLLCALAWLIIQGIDK